MTLSVTVATPGGPSPYGQFRWMVKAVQWADEVGLLVRAALQDEAPVGTGPRSPRLRNSIRYERGSSGVAVRAEFRAYVPYAGYVTAGTRPHAIRATAARALRWTTSGGDRFAVRVHHPGARANPFHERVMTRMTPLVQARFREIMEE